MCLILYFPVDNTLTPNPTLFRHTSHHLLIPTNPPAIPAPPAQPNNLLKMFMRTLIIILNQITIILITADRINAPHRIPIAQYNGWKYGGFLPIIEWTIETLYIVLAVCVGVYLTYLAWVFYAGWVLLGLFFCCGLLVELVDDGLGDYLSFAALWEAACWFSSGLGYGLFDFDEMLVYMAL